MLTAVAEPLVIANEKLKRWMQVCYARRPRANQHLVYFGLSSFKVVKLQMPSLDLQFAAWNSIVRTAARLKELLVVIRPLIAG